MAWSFPCKTAVSSVPLTGRRLEFLATRWTGLLWRRMLSDRGSGGIRERRHRCNFLGDLKMLGLLESEESRLQRNFLSLQSSSWSLMLSAPLILLSQQLLWLSISSKCWDELRQRALKVTLHGHSGG